MSHASLGDRRSPSAIVFAAFLIKLAKHLALLAGLAVVGQATSGAAVPQPAVLGLVVCAALVHTLGQILERRWRNRQPTLRDSP